MAIRGPGFPQQQPDLRGWVLTSTDLERQGMGGCANLWLSLCVTAACDADSRLALEDLAYSFGFEPSSEPDDASALPYAVEVGWRQQIINCVGPVLRGPDLLVVVQGCLRPPVSSVLSCVCSEMKPVPSTKNECTAFTCAARMIDCLSAAW